jgi:glycerol-3-phosphate acyltransferase PlsY
MPDTIAFLLSTALGYLLGSIPFGLVIVRLAGLGDIRTIGSGNIGATNVLRTGRKDLALATFLLDSGKAGIALALARWAFGPEAGFVAGGAAFLGHCFPIWLKFKGGKGVATFFGVVLVGLPLVGAAAGATWLACAFVFRFSSLAALAAAGGAPLYTFLLGGDAFAIGFTALLGVLIFWRHAGNIQRLVQGTEPKIGKKTPAV